MHENVMKVLFQALVFFFLLSDFRLLSKSICFRFKLIWKKQLKYFANLVLFSFSHFLFLLFLFVHIISKFDKLENVWQFCCDPFPHKLHTDFDKLRAFDEFKFYGMASVTLVFIDATLGWQDPVLQPAQF